MDPKQYFEGITGNSNGNSDSDKNTPGGRVKAPGNGENVKIWPENRRKGLYEPENAIFGPIFRFSAPTGAKMAKK